LSGLDIILGRFFVCDWGFAAVSSVASVVLAGPAPGVPTACVCCDQLGHGEFMARRSVAVEGPSLNRSQDRSMRAVRWKTGHIR